MSRRLLAVLLAALFSFILVACGDDGGVDEPEETTTTEEDDGGDDDGGDDGGGEFDPDARAELPDGQEPGDLGDSPAFEALAEGCFDGDMAACDVLWLESPIDSDFEAYGATCGGREDDEDPGECSVTYDWEAPEGQDPGDLGSDDDLDDLADQCFEGDFGDCDDLYAESDVDSDYEAYGITCGGRLPSVALDELPTQICQEYYGEAAS